MTHIISDRLVCGNCVNIADLCPKAVQLRQCIKYKHPVINSDICCVSFRWNGMTDSDNQLLCFPREAQEMPFLNA